MKENSTQKKYENNTKQSIDNFITIFVSILALVTTFGVSVSDFSFFSKVIIFSGIVVSFVIFSFVFRGKTVYTSSSNEITSKEESVEQIFNHEIEEKLLVLEEANKFFGASLKSADMFRLVSSRIKQIVEYETCALFMLTQDNNLECKYAVGKNARLFQSIKLGVDQGLVSRAFLSREVEVDSKLEIEKAFISREFLSGLRSAVSVPLLRAGEIFGVLNLYSDEKNFYESRSKILLEAISERVTPLLMSSMSFERSLSNALTDSLTNLPNERAFYLVLENQIAEAQRFQEQRELTILAIDIKDFALINDKFGHSTGDNVLAYSANLIRKQLRDMDFLARSQNDEFLVVLPTASEKVTENIIFRINSTFQKNPYMFPENDKKEIKLNFGAATFHQDGDTANELFKAAVRNKRQAKTNNGSVLLFPQQFVN